MNKPMTKLENVCKAQSSNIAQKDLEGNSGSYPIYGASGLIKYVDFYKQERPYIAVVKDGAGVGRVMKLPAKSSVIGTLQYIIPNEDVDIGYLAYAMEYMNLSKYYSGATIPHIYFRDYKEEKLHLPTLSEQMRQVEDLDQVCDLIAKHQQQLSKLDELVKSRFIELFGTIYNNKYGFDTVTLQDVCEPIKDGTHQTPTYTEDKQNGYMFLSSKDVTSGTIDWTHIKYIPEILHKELYARITPQKGDLLLAKNGTTGIAAIVDRDAVFDIYVSLALLRPKEVNSVYLWGAVNSAETKKQFDESLKGIGVPNLHLGEIKKTKIVLPPIDHQNKFAAFVEQTDKLKLAVKESMEKLETLKRSLMQGYFG